MGLSLIFVKRKFQEQRRETEKYILKNFFDEIEKNLKNNTQKEKKMWKNILEKLRKTEKIQKVKKCKKCIHNDKIMIKQDVQKDKYAKNENLKNENEYQKK